MNDQGVQTTCIDKILEKQEYITKLLQNIIINLGNFIDKIKINETKKEESHFVNKSYISLSNFIHGSKACKKAGLSNFQVRHLLLRHADIFGGCYEKKGGEGKFSRYYVDKKKLEDLILAHYTPKNVFQRNLLNSLRLEMGVQVHADART
jgi:hypothetical protein